MPLLPFERIRQIAVVGAGTMGSQIAQLAAMKGYDVVLNDRGPEDLEQATNRIKNNLDVYFVKKGKITATDADAAFGRIALTTDLEQAVRDADYVIEAIFENLQAKKELFARFDRAARPEIVLASNTSGLSLTKMGEATSRPARVVGMHFFNPVLQMKLVEIVRGQETSDEAVAIARQVSEALDKVPVVCKDVRGFIANRVYGAMGREATDMVMRGLASPGDVDTAMKLGYGLPMGPCELRDYTGGWGLYRQALRTPLEPDEEPIPGYRPEVQERVNDMLERGYLGRHKESNGKGIYDYYEEFIKGKV